MNRCTPDNDPFQCQSSSKSDRGSLIYLHIPKSTSLNSCQRFRCTSNQSDSFSTTQPCENSLFETSQQMLSSDPPCHCSRIMYVGKGLLSLRRKLKSGRKLSLSDLESDPCVNAKIIRSREINPEPSESGLTGVQIYDKLPSSPAAMFLSRISDLGSLQSNLVSSLGIGDRIGDYTVGPKISDTGFSTVYAANHKCFALKGKIRGENKLSSYSFVVKAISHSMSPMGLSMSKIIRNELYMWSTLCHENIVRMVDYMILNKDAFIVSELMDGGNMLEFLNKCPNRPSESEVKSIFRMILSGLHYLHSVARVFHGDLKLENILLNSDGCVKISDFGLTASVSSESQDISDSHFSYSTPLNSFFGSIVYCPPEVISGSKIVGGIEFDIWSLGCILYALATRVLPFRDMLLPRLKDSIISVSYDKHLLVECGVSKELISQIDRILKADPSQRPNTYQIINSPWLRNSSARSVHHRRLG